MLALGLDTFYVSPGSTSRNKTKTCFIEYVADWPILMNLMNIVHAVNRVDI